MPEMTEENYRLLMERLDKMQADYDTKINDLIKKNADLAAMNMALVGRTKESPAADEDKAKVKEALNKKLDGGLKYARK